MSYTEPWEFPDYVRRRGRFAGLKNWQVDVVKEYEKFDDSAVNRECYTILNSIPPLRRVSWVYTPPTLKVGLRSVRYNCGGWHSTKGIDGKLRGKINAFSRASQRRMRDCVEDMIFSPRFFFTLTYPPSVAPDDMEKAFYQLRDFCRVVDKLHKGYRQGKKPVWIWKKEFQKNGNVHFHIVSDIEFSAHDFSGDWFIKFPKHYNKKKKKELLSTIHSDRYICKAVIERLQDIWCLVIEHNARNSLDISSVLSVSAIGQYLAKYVSKEDGSQTVAPQGVQSGRWWGVLNRASVQRVDKRVFNLVDGVDSSNLRKTISARDSGHRAVFQWLHDFLDSADYQKKWRKDLRTNGYVKNDWFLPQDKLILSILEDRLLDVMPYFDVFTEQIFFRI